MPDDTIAKTPEPPYYAVIFSSHLTGDDLQGYRTVANEMVKLAHAQPGFLGVESGARDPNTRLGITVSYWKDQAAILAWKQQLAHRQAQDQGRSKWYQSFRLRVAKVERDYGFER